MNDMHRGAAPLVIRGPQDLVAAVPYLLGFHPADSLVAVGCGGPHGSCALRFDLPLCGQAADQLAALLIHHRFPTALLAGYGPARRVTPAVEAVRGALRAAGIELREALRVEGERYWSYLCQAGCCPPEGTPITTTSLAAQAVLDGLVALPAREQLAATIAPLGGPVRASMRHETRLAEARPPDPLADGLPLVRALAFRTARGEPPPSDRETAQLGLALTSLRVRDEAWVRIDPAASPVHLAFWRHVLQRVEPAYVPAPACLFAYTAYLGGDGGLANLALDLCDRSAPDYSMSLLLRQALTTGLHPSQAVLTLTPEDLATAYNDPV